MQVAHNVGEAQTSNPGLTVTIAMQPPTKSLPNPQPHMPNRAHREWILDLPEELDVDDGHEHDSDYEYDSSGDSPDPTIEVERRIVRHFSEHLKLCKQFKHPSQKCALYPLWLQVIQIGGRCLHARREDPHKPTTQCGLAGAIRWLHGGKEPPRQ